MSTIRDNGLRRNIEDISTKTADWWRCAMMPESKALYEILPEDAHDMLERLKSIFFDERKALEEVIADYSDHLIDRLFDLIPDAPEGDKNDLERRRKVEEIAEHQMLVWYYMKLKEVFDIHAIHEFPGEIRKLMEHHSRPIDRRYGDFFKK